MRYTIQLPHPCTADWNDMTPEGSNRHCGQCNKTVIDFTRWELPDILFYLEQHKGTCGRFLPAQLGRPIPGPELFLRQLGHSRLSFPARIAVLIVFVFGIMTASCNDTGERPKHQTAPPQEAGTTTGAPVKVSQSAPPAQKHRKKDPSALVGDTALAVPEPEMPLGGAPVIEAHPGGTGLPTETKDTAKKE